MEPTQDPHTFIEGRGNDWIRYRAGDGRRWEVRGACVGVGNCIIGSVVVVAGRPTEVRDHEHLTEMRDALGSDLGFTVDSPVASGFAGCCSFDIVELPP